LKRQKNHYHFLCQFSLKEIKVATNVFNEFFIENGNAEEIVDPNLKKQSLELSHKHVKLTLTG
jgi:hypothetical protein